LSKLWLSLMEVITVGQHLVVPPHFYGLKTLPPDKDEDSASRGTTLL
jgi:hypothetical protein